VETRSKGTNRRLPALALHLRLTLICGLALTARCGPLSAQPPADPAQSSSAPAQPSGRLSPANSAPPQNPAFFPLRDVRPGLTGTAWTVFQGSAPEPMQVEILGVLHGGRGPGQDLILGRLHGAKPEYTGVVAGMSGSPVYIGDRLLGSLSYRIGVFAKEPIAGITPIEQILEVLRLPAHEKPAPDLATPDLDSPDLAAATPWGEDPGSLRTDLSPWGGSLTPATTSSNHGDGTNLFAAAEPDSPSLLAGNPPSASSPTSGSLFSASNSTIQPIETPLIMSGFDPGAIRFWQQQTAGTALESVVAGGGLSFSPASSALDSTLPIASAALSGSSPDPSPSNSTAIPGSAVSMQLIRGDLEIAATCTVTYVDPTQLIACGHPVLETGPVSLPMTTASVIATLASPFDAFKIINTGATIGAFTQDRESGIRGAFGAEAQMIPLHLDIDAPEGRRKLNVEILDHPTLSPLAMEVVLLQALLQSNESSAFLSYHVTGNVDLDGFPPVPLDVWAPAGQPLPAQIMAALFAGDKFTRLYTNGARRGVIRTIDLHVQAVPRNVQVALEHARLISTDIAHAGDTVQVEATLRPWHQSQRNVRVAVKLPARLAPGNLRLLVSDGATLDRTLLQPHFSASQPDLATVLAEARNQHPADHVYVSLLAPETQGELRGQTLTSLPPSVANALEPLRNAQDASLNGESAEIVGEAPAGGLLSGFEVLNLHIEPGAGLD